jgi:hypothetical protein
VTGTELRRQLHEFVEPNGTVMYVLAVWSSRTRNEVKNGIEWDWGDWEYECVDGLPFSSYASLFEREEDFAGALADASLVPSGTTCTILLGAFVPFLARSVSSARRLSFSVVREGGRHSIVAVAAEASGARTEVARAALDVDRKTGVVSVGKSARRTKPGPRTRRTGGAT